jgi:hypothetical protein
LCYRNILSHQYLHVSSCSVVSRNNRWVARSQERSCSGVKWQTILVT